MKPTKTGIVCSETLNKCHPTSSTWRARMRSFVLVAAVIVIAPLICAPVGGAEATQRTSTDDARAAWQAIYDSSACREALASIASGPAPTDAQAFLNEVEARAFAPCALDQYASIFKAEQASQDTTVISSQVCPGADGIGTNTIYLGGILNSEEDAAGQWTGTQDGGLPTVHASSVVVALVMSGKTGSVLIAGVPLPAFGDSSSRCSTITTTTCVTFLWIFSKCATSNTLVPCDSDANGDVLHLGLVTVSAHLEAGVDPCATLPSTLPAGTKVDLSEPKPAALP